MAAINSVNGELVYMMKDKYFLREDSIAFIKKLQDKHGNGRLTLFWDNARIHAAKEVREYLDTQNRVTEIINIPYLPEFNGIEMLWADSKR